MIDFQQNNFQSRILPKQIKDELMEKWYRDNNSIDKAIFRRATMASANSKNLQILDYSSFQFNPSMIFSEIATFGPGIGIYFMQLIILFFILLIAGGISLINVSDFMSNSYGCASKNIFLYPTGACSTPINVTSHNCVTTSKNVSCFGTALLRKNCDIPSRVAWVDLGVSLFLIFGLVISKYAERFVEKLIDKTVQSIDDYSIIINDPDPSATNPDEWHKFFSQYGDIRYVTVAKNGQINQLVLEKHLCIRQFEELSSPTEVDQHKYTTKLSMIDARIQAAYKVKRGACKVFITFEYEAQARGCLDELNTSWIQAALDWSSNEKFRGSNVLDVERPVLPDNFNWMYIDVPFFERCLLQG